MRADDAHLLSAVALTPYASAGQLADIWQARSEGAARRSLARLIRQQLVQTVGYRDPYDPATLKLHFLTDRGAALLSETSEQSEIEEASRQWQRHIHRHLDTAGLAYDLVRNLSVLSGRRPAWYFPRQGSFDALIWQDFQEGLSIGIIRVGATLPQKQLSARLAAIKRGDELLNHHQSAWGRRRGPGLLLITVPTELEKDWLCEWFRPGGFYHRTAGLLAVVATEKDAREGRWTQAMDGAPVSISGMAAFKPTKSDFSPKAPDAYEWLPPVPVKALPPPLLPVQSRILDALYRWPLMRPTEIAPTIGVTYDGRFNSHLHTLTTRKLVKDIRELARAGLVEYDHRGEYRDFPQLLSDKGVLHLAARDRTKSGRNRARSAGKDKSNPAGLLDRLGTEGKDDHGKRYLGGDIGKLSRELDHTLGANAVVAKFCKDLDYTPDVLPDHLNRRYYKTNRWTAAEFLVGSSVAPDAALVLRTGDRRRTLLIEFERHATQGGKALTRKLSVWIEYSRARGHAYLGHEAVAFIVPTEKSRDLLATRLQEIMPRHFPIIQVVVITEADFHNADSVIDDQIWTLATDERLPKVRLTLRPSPPQP